METCMPTLQEIASVKITCPSLALENPQHPLESYVAFFKLVTV